MLVADRSTHLTARKYRELLRRDVRDGAMAGLLAGAGIMVLVFGFDMLFFSPLTLPGFLSGALSGGEDIATVVPALLGPAVYNATGVWVDDYPITPDKVLEALGKV